MAGIQLNANDLRAWLATQPAIKRPRLAAVGLHLPVNAGMILRIADAVHAQEVIFIDADHAHSRKMHRASRMMSDHMPHQFISAADFMAQAQRWGTCVAVEITSASRNVYDVVLPDDITLIVGAERHGIPQVILDFCAYAVHVPMFGQLSSMNVAVSTAVVAYEWVRQQLQRVG